jgi:ribonucleoside-triphosphate reductase
MREGWARAWGQLFDAASGLRSANGVSIDVSDVRKAGAIIETFGGTASGPAPLVKSIVACYIVLQRAVGRHMTSVEAMECDHHIASAVVAGGARRSARMSIVHWQDPQIMEFISCKTNHMLHWTTNISVEVDDEFVGAIYDGDAHATNVLHAMAAGMIANGEPGLYNSSLAAVGERGDVRSTNPCGEICLEEGESCNIGSVDLDLYGTDEDGAIEAFRLMARFLIRSTLIKPYSPAVAEVEARNRRIGVGFLGMQGWAAAHGVRYEDIPSSEMLATKLHLFRQVIREEADRYCNRLGISKCIKVTAIAPNGTISQLRGTQPGVHSVIARWFWRRVRFTVGDPGIDEAYKRGLYVEPCIYADNTMVVRYPVQDSILNNHPAHLIQQADEISLDAQLAVLAFVTNTFCYGNDGNAVSFTANLDTSVYTRPEDLAPVITQWLPDVKGLTVFPSMSRPQSPYEPITEVEYLSALIEGQAFSGSSNDGECAGGACPVR